MWFYSNHEKTNNGFEGTWEFIDAMSSLSVPYDMGTTVSNMCGYTVHSKSKSRGFVMSSTYPGVYPDNTFCFYRLEGEPGQRIKLVFEDFSLFHGGEYCPFDYLRIYDGNSTSSEVIGTFCGSYNQSTVIFSSGRSLRLDFITGGGGRLTFNERVLDTMEDYKVERRGFNISYVFSNDFVALDHHFIKDGAKHVVGTECDQRILSGKETNGTFVSPGYPGSFPQGIVCRYYLDGLMDDQCLEKVKVMFYDFNITGNIPYCLLGYLGETDSDGTVKNKFCGALNPPNFVSLGPRMVITLNTTGGARGGKFVARYQFITDYGIHGEQIEEGKCKFHYNSMRVKQGEINSPRHPGNYPNNQDCEYIFRPQPGEVLLLTFHIFLLSTKSDPPSSPPLCSTVDNVAFYEDVGTPNRENFTLTARYCGNVYPGPYATHKLLKVIFHSNDDSESYVGFRAKFQFYKSRANFSCSTYNSVIKGGGLGGTIISPNFPAKYTSLVWCEWIIQASRRENKILVEISDLNLEGNYMKDADKSSCQDSVLRLYDDSLSLKPVSSICGIKKATEENPSYLSLQTSFKISFITAPGALGAKGFKISWTEVQTGSSLIASDCSGFQCVVNKYCIATALKCNKEPNCGSKDNSDETAECPRSSGIKILHIAIGTSISSFFCIILLICGFYHRRKFRSDRAPPDHDHVEVRYVSAPTGCNTTDRLLMDDRNDVGNDHHNNSTTQSPRCQKVSMV
ncbi:cubilin-like isoform X2 [Physella acuta]|uniref:cubilin-like isoform X2 n=1 Tax=Physella acuta TaxID=109671 RepID=UPI0027DE5681|nr:cubilin-like isoform X2 [Physella acuta]